MGQMGMNLENVKIRNKSTILKLLNSKGAMSRKDIARDVGLTPASVTLLCTEMIEEGTLAEKGEMQEERRAGRKKVLVDINYTCKYAVTVSIEAKKTYITICDLKGRAIVDKKIVTDVSINPEDFFQAIAKECKSLLWENKVHYNDVLGVGICIPGIVDRKRGVSIHAYGIWKTEVKVKEWMESLMQCPVIVENNVKAFAEGELAYGLGRIGENLLFVKWGPGVGSAIVIRDKVYEGKNHKAAEIGHYIIEPGGLACRCGRNGCLETRVSTKAIIEKIRSIYSEKETPVLYRQTEGKIERVTEEVFTRWMNKNKKDNILSIADTSVIEIIDKNVEKLAGAITNIMTILAPDHTIIFGSMFDDDDVWKMFLKYCQSYDSNYTEDYIRRSKLSDRIYYVGAAAIVTRELFFDRGSAGINLINREIST